MGGQVHVTSVVNEGSVFSITFRMMCRIASSDKLLKKPTVVDSNKIRKTNRKPSNNSIGSVVKGQLLLANDDPFLLFGYCDQLEQHFNVETAENGLQAVQIISSYPPDYFHVIILDINMPIMDGYEACVRIDELVEKAGCLKPFIYALTADANPETVERISHLPFEALFNKLDENIEIKHIRQ